MDQPPADGRPAPTHDGPPPRFVARVVLRSCLTVTVLLVLYYVLPFDRALSANVIVVLGVGLAVVGAVTVLGLRAIVRSDNPGARAVETVALAVPLFIVLFATVYDVMAVNNAGSFTEPLTRTDSLYFTITILSTVGFGDITPKTEAARIVVSVQMLLDLVLIGLVVRAVVTTARDSMRRRHGTDRPVEDRLVTRATATENDPPHGP